MSVANKSQIIGAGKFRMIKHINSLHSTRNKYLFSNDGLSLSAATTQTLNLFGKREGFDLYLASAISLTLSSPYSTTLTWANLNKRCLSELVFQIQGSEITGQVVHDANDVLIDVPYGFSQSASQIQIPGGTRIQAKTIDQPYAVMAVNGATDFRFTANPAHSVWFPRDEVQVSVEDGSLFYCSPLYAEVTGNLLFYFS